MAGVDADAEAHLESLMEENAALQAENAALRLETNEHSVAFERDGDAIEPTSEEEAAWLQVKVEALRREREALQNVLCLADKLKALQTTNIVLMEADRQLTEQNSSLEVQNLSLREGFALPKLAACSPAVGSRSVPEPSAAGVAPGRDAEGSFDRKLYDLIQLATSKYGVDVLMTCSHDQRKELVAAMLQAGLFSPFCIETDGNVELAHATVPPAAMCASPARGLVSGGADVAPALWPVSMGGGQDVVEAVRREGSLDPTPMSGEQRKQMMANMLKDGVFSAPPEPIYATAAEERAMDVTLLPPEGSMPESPSYCREFQMKTLLSGLDSNKPMPSSTTEGASGGEERKVAPRNDYAREMAIRKKLDGLRGARR